MKVTIITLFRWEGGGGGGEGQILHKVIHGEALP